MKKQIIIGTITLAIVAGGLIYGSNKKAKKSNSYVYSVSEVLSYNKSVDYTKVKFKKADPKKLKTFKGSSDEDDVNRYSLSI